MITKLYDQPGSWLVDHPNARVAVAAIVGGLVFAAAAPAVSAPALPHKNPGSIREYKASSVEAGAVRE